jgi:hypothetical protein
MKAAKAATIREIEDYEYAAHRMTFQDFIVAKETHKNRLKCHRLAYNKFTRPPVMDYDIHTCRTNDLVDLEVLSDPEAYVKKSSMSN